MLSPDQAKTLVFQHYSLLKKMALAHFGDDPIAEEAFNYVLDHLQEHQWARVCQYANPAERGVTVFLHRIVKMLLIDFARKSGRVPHIPKWVTERGEFWRLAYRLLIVELQLHEEVRARHGRAARYRRPHLLAGEGRASAGRGQEVGRGDDQGAGRD